MNLLAAILAFMIAALPVQAGFCDMGPAGEPSQHMDMQHDMPDNDRSGHDCCAPTGEDGGGNCDTMVQCGTCSVATVAISALPAISPVPEWVFRSDLNDSGVPPSHASPPYRPPIYIS